MIGLSCFPAQMVVTVKSPMGLKTVVDSLDDVPEAARGAYTLDEETKKFKLDVDDVVPKSKFEEFRSTNKRLTKEQEELKKKFEGVDPDEFKTLKTKYEGVDPEELQALKDELATLKETGEKGKQQTKAELEEQITNLQKKQKKEQADLLAKHKETIDALNGKISAQSQALAKALIDSQITSVALENSVRPEAMTDVALRASKVFSVHDGQVVAYQEDGEKWISDATDKYITIGEWLKMLVKEAPHLFKDSSGTGSGGNQSVKGNGQAGVSKALNPWREGKDKHRTEQAQYIKTHGIPAAREAAIAVGVKPQF